MNNRVFRLSAVSVLLLAWGGLSAGLFAQEGAPTGGTPANGISPDGSVLWFRSNASGIALEPVPSRLAALRNGYCLSIQTVPVSELPENLLPYHGSAYRIELRTLYQEGSVFRRQWIFRDGNGIPRLAASGTGAFFDGGPGEEPVSGFIEIRNSAGALERELRFEEDGSAWEFLFSYNGDTLLSAGTLFKNAGGDAEGEAGFTPVTTDYYRYSRFGSLRAVDRVLHGGAGVSRVPFPRIGPDISPGGNLVTRGMAYTPEFLEDVYSPGDSGIRYTLDSRGRILTGSWTDGEDRPAGEYLYTWEGDTLKSVLWKDGGSERLVEYGYDDEGNRIMERNFRQGVLERSVTVREGKDIEEIYMDGKIILRAVWENGLKISEERVPPPRPLGAPQSSGGQP